MAAKLTVLNYIYFDQSPAYVDNFYGAKDLNPLLFKTSTLIDNFRLKFGQGIIVPALKYGIQLRF